MEIKNILLDYGHGGLDKYGRYTTAPAKMFIHANKEIAYEGVINRQIGKKIFDLLSTHKELNVVEVVKSNDATDVSLADRVAIVNKFNPKETIMISIHNNASPNNKGRGFEIFSTKGQTKSDSLAEAIAEEVEVLFKSLKLQLRFDTSDGDKDKEADFYVIRKSNCPAVLLECLFFDNFEDFKYLKDDKFQCDFANAVYKGIMKYVRK